MPRQRDFPLFERPSTYGFERFDDLVQRLHVVIPDAEILAEVLEALQTEGRQLDADQLGRDLQLEHPALAIIEQPASWGDGSEQIHHYARVQIASINAGSLAGHTDLTTLVFAQRVEHGLTVFFEDENGGLGELGEFERPLSLLELIVVIDSVLLRQAPYDVTEGDWRTGYISDPSMIVRASSRYYRLLSAGTSRRSPSGSPHRAARRSDRGRRRSAGASASPAPHAAAACTAGPAGARGFGAVRASARQNPRTTSTWPSGMSVTAPGRPPAISTRGPRLLNAAAAMN